jgi:hypothetical protein
MEEGRRDLPGKEGDRGRTALDKRWLVEAVLGSAARAVLGAIRRTSSVSLAYRVHVLLPLATQRGLAACRARHGWPGGNRTHPDRFEHRPSTPTFGWGIKKMARKRSVVPEAG